MRLHLPLSLRSALLAVFASTLAVTAHADVTFTSSNGTITVSGQADGTYIASLLLHGDYASATKIIFALTSPNNAYFDTDTTIDKAIQIGDGSEGTGLWFNNGSGTTLTLSGAVTGSGTISVTNAGTGRKILFTGDTTGFSGEIIMGATVNTTIQFGNGGAAPATSSDQGLAGSGNISLSSTNNILAFNYSGGASSPIYFTNTVTGTGAINVLGSANMTFTGAIAATNLNLTQTGSADLIFKGAVTVTTLNLSPSNGSTIQVYLKDYTPSDASSSEVVFSNLTVTNFSNAGTGTVSVHLADKADLKVNSSGTGTTLLDNQTGGKLVIWNSSYVTVKGGTYVNIWNTKGNLTLIGQVSVEPTSEEKTGELRGASTAGNFSTTTIGDGETETTVTTSKFYGHYEHATTDTTTSRTTITINNNATLKATDEAQIARDGIGELNILTGGTFISGTSIELGSDWSGTADSGKQAIINLKGGTIVVGSGGIVQKKNTSSIGVLNFTTGTLTGTADWSSSCPMNILGDVTVGTTKYVETGSSTDPVTITLSGALTGSGYLIADGAGTLALSSDTSALTGGVILASGALTLNSDLVAPLTIKNGTLNGGNYVTKDSNATINGAENATITTKGLESAKVKSVALAEGATLTVQDSTGASTNLDLTDKTVALSLTSANVNVDNDATSTPSAKINATALTLTSSSTTLDLSNEALITLLGKTTDTAKLQVTSGTLTFSDGDTYKSALMATSSIISQVGLAISDIEGGAIILSGSIADVWLVTGDESKTYPDQISAYRSLDPYAAVAIDKGETLTVSLAGAPTAADGDKGLQVKNLIGVSGSELKVTNSDSDAGSALVILNNSSSKDAVAELEDGDKAVAVDSKMEGKITSGSGVEFVKQGTGTLTVTGEVNIDTLKGEQGTLALQQSSDKIAKLVLSSDDANPFSLTLSNGASLSTSIFDTKSDEFDNPDYGYSGDVSTNGGTITIDSDSTLTVIEKSDLSHSTITGTGQLNVNADLTLSEDAKLGGTLGLGIGKGATFTLAGPTEATVSSLSGEGGALDLGGATLTIDGASNDTFDGDLESSGTIVLESGKQQLASAGNINYSLDVEGGELTLLQGSSSSSTQALRGLRAASSSDNSLSYKEISVASGATLIIGNSSTPNTLLTVGEGGLTVDSGATLTFTLDVSELDELKALSPLVTSKGDVALNSNSTLTLDDLDIIATADDPELKVELMKSTDGDATLGSVTLNATFLSSAYQDLALLKEGTSIWLTGVARKDNIFAPSATTPNSQAGSELLWGARTKLGSGASPLKSLYRAVLEMQNNNDKASATRTLAAAAGSTVNSLGTAQRDALRTQLGWVRNRTTLMGLPQDYTHEELPYYHMWIEGTASTSKLNSEGDEGGYKLNTWGATVGFDADLTSHFTMGAALTAQYGDLTSSAAEYASGDLDSYYISLFGRYQNNRWAHTVILTGAKNDASLNRTVDYGSGSYTTKGDTDGSGFGAMYELTYDIPLDEDKTSMFQPLFNASIVKTSMKSYTESGAGNAGLEVGKQEWTTGTLAVGGRWMGLVGTNVFGREALLEVRANVAQDFGDDQGETKVGFIGNPKFTQTVYGASEGKTAFQAGVGLSLPVGQQGTIFCNGNADIRSGAHSFNGTIGYRYSF